MSRSLEAAPPGAGAMRAASLLGVFLVSGVVGLLPARGDAGRGERQEEYRDGPWWVKRETKPDGFKEEIKCPKGVGARWRGEWKQEYRDGACRVKIEAKRDEYQKEVKCE